MTEQEKQQLSRDVAAKLGIAPYRFIATSIDNFVQTWLTEDSARCFDLAVNNYIGTHHYADFKTGKCYCVEAKSFDGRTVLFEDYDKHNDDAQEATRIAILRALLAKGE